MSTRFVTNLNLNQNQILNGRFQALPSDPTENLFDGWIYFNTTQNKLRIYNGTEWRTLLNEVASATTALTLLEEDGTVTLTIADAVNNAASGLMTGADKKKLDDATAADSVSTLVIRDGSGRFQVATPSADLDAANKGYVDSARAGLDVKASVKAATTGPVTLSTDLEAGDTLDGYTLVAGDRILVKDQDTDSENGIYQVSATGAPVRTVDGVTGTMTAGAFVFVEQGTLNADSGWVLITDEPITVGTTGLEFSLFSVAGNILAGAGLSKTGDTLDVNVDGTSIEISSDELRIASGAAGDALSWDEGVLNVEVTSTGGLEVDSDALGIKLDSGVFGLTTTTDGLALDTSIAGDGLTFTAGVLSRDTIDLTDDVTGTLPIENGGTNATSASDARTTLAATPTSGANTTTPVIARVASRVIGDGASLSYTITHNFGTRAVVVQVFDSNLWDTVIADVVRTTTDSVTVSFSVAPASGAFTVVVTG